jgi:hypothetical protein
VLGEAEVDVWEVDEDGNVRLLLADVADQLAVLRVDEGRVADDFGDAHVGDVFGADDALLAGALHLRAAKTGEAGAWELRQKRMDQRCAVRIA